MPARDRVFDLAIIGGGVNGCGIARDAAGRGLSVFLCEQGDLASGTSSASTKLVHGGLRYLEQFAFRLVRESLAEREVLLRAAPHLVRPMRFVLPHRAGLRPAWMVRAGLALYDTLGGRGILPGTRTLDLRTDPAGAALKPGLTRAFEYSDCWVDDARLVIANALDASERGAEIATRTKCGAARRVDGLWQLALEGPAGPDTASARALVNATGPWVAHVLREVVGTTPSVPVRLVKGSHIVVPSLFAHDRAYLFQNPDKRVVFAIPYEDEFTLIGTTDRDFSGDPAEAAITDEETYYLCAAASGYFASPVEPSSIVHAFAGVRPLVDDGRSDAASASRDYRLDLDAGSGKAPRLDVLGGKITTYRRLAEHALAKLAPHLPDMGPDWTRDASLPGGDLPLAGLGDLAAGLAARHPFLAAHTAARLARAYGTRAERVLGEATRAADLGRDFGHGLSEAEIRYLMAEEWAVTAEDILWRRSKLGLYFSPAETEALGAFMAQHAPAPVG